MTQVAFDPQKFLAVVDGSPVIDPADVDEAFLAEYADDRVTVVKGMYGAGGFEINVATNATFTIMVKGKSPDNERFSAIHQARRQVRIQFVNKNSNTEAASTQAAMVQSFTGVGGGISQGDRTWVFGVGEAQILPGGNKTYTPLPV